MQTQRDWSFENVVVHLKQDLGLREASEPHVSNEMGYITASYPSANCYLRWHLTTKTLTLHQDTQYSIASARAWGEFSKKVAPHIATLVRNPETVFESALQQRMRRFMTQ